MRLNTPFSSRRLSVSTPAVMTTTMMMIVMMMGFAAGCASPLTAAELSITPQPLRTICTALERTVRAAHDDAEVEWHAGWVGNMQVNWNESGHFGLCHHWQDIVYAGVIDTVHEVGWEATGVRINDDTVNEHHAVVVFDPQLVQRDDLLRLQPGQRAWVLDGWKRGRADVYEIEEWIRMPLITHREAELEALPYKPADGSKQPWLRGY